MRSREKNPRLTMPQPTDYTAKLIKQLRNENLLLRQKILQYQTIHNLKNKNSQALTISNSTLRTNQTDDIQQRFMRKLTDLQQRRSSKSLKKNQSKTNRIRTEQVTPTRKEYKTDQNKKIIHSRNKTYLEDELDKQNKQNIVISVHPSFLPSNTNNELNLGRKSIEKLHKRLSNHVYIQQSQE